MDAPIPLPGFLAATELCLDRVGGLTADERRIPSGPASIAFWGLEPVAADPATLILSRVVRTAGGAVSDTAVAAGVESRPESLGRLLPPFAAVRGDASGVSMVADSMGLRQLYHSAPGAEEDAVMSTSALAVGRATGAGLDDSAVAVQSQLGWQLGQRTLISGVQKLEPGVVAHLDATGVHLTRSAPPPLEPISIEESVAEAAALLRESVGALLDEHPDAVLQLTGGQDSRLLLSAIPPSRRRGLRAMTLGVAGDGDVEVAARLAARDGLVHEVHGMGSLENITPAEAWELTVEAARRLDGMADPLALAALTVAEGAFEQGVRISGLGGEVARGFYYVGSVRDRSYTRQDAQQLASWRMFANESVESAALSTDFASWARDAANTAVFDAVTAGGPEWFRATDSLYFRHRMQRWAGVTDTAVAYERIVVNPMLDENFLMLANRLAPADKAHSRFLASLQMELDPELGRIPLEGRPAPVAYAQPGPLRAVSRSVTSARKAARKVAQRIRRGNRAPAGGIVLAAKVAEHWQEHPDAVEGAALSGFLSDAWLGEVLAGRAQPRPSSVAFITSLVVAAGGVARSGTAS